MDFNKTIVSKTTPLPGSKPEATRYKLTVKQKYDRLSVLEFFSKAIPSVSKSDWIQKINEGRIRVEGKIVDVNFIVRAGNVTENTSEPRTEPEVSNQIKKIFEDEHLLVIDKPAPLPMHPSGRFNKNTLFSFLHVAFPEIEYKLIHRLDANTTGVVIIGKDEKTTQKLHRQFGMQEVSKTYLALVEGIITEDRFSSHKSISADKEKSGSRTIVKGNGDSVTDFEVLARYPKLNQSLLKVIPHSGKTNQIRLHLADAGYPIVGDYGYKDPDYFSNNPLTYPEDSLCLHAWKLEIKHPITMDAQCFTSPIPEKFPDFKE